MYIILFLLLLSVQRKKYSKMSRFSKRFVFVVSLVHGYYFKFTLTTIGIGVSIDLIFLFSVILILLL